MEPECGQQKERPCFSDRELDAAMNLRTGDMETGEGDSGSYIMKSGKWNKLLGNGG